MARRRQKLCPGLDASLCSDTRLRIHHVLILLSTCVLIENLSRCKNTSPLYVQTMPLKTQFTINGYSNLSKSDMIPIAVTAAPAPAPWTIIGLGL